MLKTYLIGFGLLLLYSVACSDHGKTGKLARIDSLINEVSVLDSIIHSFDYDSIKKISIDVRTTIGCIGEHIQGVPEGDSMNLRIARFSVIAKALKRFFETKNNLDYHVVYSKSQLDSLRYDIENDLETTLYFDKYFEMENNAISDMKEEIALFANIKEDLDFYYRYRMSIYGLRDSLLKSDNHDLTKK